MKLFFLIESIVSCSNVSTMKSLNLNLTSTDETSSNVSTKWVLTISYGIIELFGLCGNILVILTICSGPRRFQSNYYRLVFHLALCDIVLLLSGNITFTIGPWIETHIWSSDYGTAFCTFLLFVAKIVGSFFVTEMAILLVIAILRYKAIKQPLQPKVSSKRLKCIIVLVYNTPIFLFIPKFFSQEKNFIYYNIYDIALDLSITIIPIMFLIVLYAMCNTMCNTRIIQYVCYKLIFFLQLIEHIKS